MYDKRIKLVISIIVISIVLGIILALNFSKEKLSLIVDSLTTAEATYLIDDDGKEINLYKIDKEGKIISIISEDKIKDDNVADFSDLIIDGNNVYVYKIVREIERGNIVLSEEIYYCDFDRGNLELKWELPMEVEYAQNSLFPTVQNGDLYFFNYDYNIYSSQARAILYKMDNESTEHIAQSVVHYNGDIGFTNLIYTKSGEVIFETPEGKIFKAMSQEEYKDLYSNTVTITTPNQDQLVFENNMWVPADVEEIANNKLSEKPTSGVVYIENELVPVQIYPYGSETSKEGLVGQISSDGKNEIYFLRFDSKEYYSFDVTTNVFDKVEVPHKFEETYIQIDEYDIKNIKFTDRTTYTGSVLGEAMQGDKLVVYENGKISTYEYVIKTTGQVVLSAVIYSVICFIVFILIYVLWELFLMFTRGKVPVVAKVIAVCVPVVIAGGLTLQVMINDIFVNQIVENLYKELYLLSEEKHHAIISTSESIFETDTPHQDYNYITLQRIFNNLPSQAVIYEQEQNEELEIYNFSYHYFYTVKDGKLRSLITNSNIVNTPVDYMYGKDTVDMFYDAANEKKIISGSYRDLEGEWIVILNPILDSDGNVIGILESGAPKTFLEYQVNENTKVINTVNIVIQIILILLLSLLIILCLRPLIHLKTCVNDIINGNMGVQAKIHGRDEIADIGNVFNNMSKSIEVSVNELRLLNEGYFKFVPSKMFSILRKSSVIDIKLGDEVSTNIAVFTVNGNEFDNVMGELTSDKMFDLINGMYSSMVPIVTQYNGVVDRFEQAGLVAFYTGDVSDAIDTAITVAQKADLVNNERKMNGLEIVQISSAICYGTVMLGIVGHEKRLSATTISQYTQLSSYLRKIAPIFGARIITTQTVIDKISDFESKYSYRYLGFIHIKTSDIVEKIYDVYDGDCADDKVLKRNSCDIFERAVNLYTEKDFYEARLLFIEVLKLNRNDLAAKEYLYRCDNYYQLKKEEQEKVDIFIEEY